MDGVEIDVVACGWEISQVYDTVGGLDHYQRSLKVLKPGGYYISIVGDTPSNMTVTKLVTTGVDMVLRSWPFTSTVYRLWVPLCGNAAHAGPVK